MGMGEVGLNGTKRLGFRVGAGHQPANMLQAMTFGKVAIMTAAPFDRLATDAAAGKRLPNGAQDGTPLWNDRHLSNSWFKVSKCDGFMLKFLRRKRLHDDWWRSAFTHEERRRIEEAFKPLGSISAESLARSDDLSSLGNLAGHLNTEGLRHLGYRVLDRAETLLTPSTRTLSQHFYLADRGSFYYRWRDIDEGALKQSILAYERQISIAAEAAKAFKTSSGGGLIPGHAGYRQLRIIREKQGDYTAALQLCEQAKQQGWADDWDKHTARIKKRMVKKHSK